MTDNELPVQTTNPTHVMNNFIDRWLTNYKTARKQDKTKLSLLLEPNEVI